MPNVEVKVTIKVDGQKVSKESYAKDVNGRSSAVALHGAVREGFAAQAEKLLSQTGW